MSQATLLIEACILVACACPALLLALLALPSLLRRPLPERVVGALVSLFFTLGLAATTTGLVCRLTRVDTPEVVSFGRWFSFESGAFALDFFADGLAFGFATLAMGVCGVVSAFSFRYLHREAGFHRYFVQLGLFVLGITLVALAGSVDVLFAGWECLGLSSVLLVGFFHERVGPVRNALRVFAIYRVSDAAMLSAAVLLHHWASSGSLSDLFSRASATTLGLEPHQTTVVAVLILLAVAGKSALWPFSGWLPRAMEGPTPSSAVYYGALSIHAGCFLLLRAEPLLSQSSVAQTLAVAAGAVTAVYATLVARVQVDIKSALAYACLTQVGIIVVEIGLGATRIAFVHIVGHACFRLLQFLSAPNVLHDLNELEGRVGARALEPAHLVSKWPRVERLAYLASLERGFVDALLDGWVVRPFLVVAGRLDALDRWLTGSCEPPPGPLPSAAQHSAPLEALSSAPLDAQSLEPGES